ncbi:MAG: alpha-mannosidase, partial [Candidatus Limnocylindria bacterium]
TELLIPEAWQSVALELPDGSRVATQELSRKEAVLFDASLRGDEVDDLFRRFHGREVFDHAWNGYTVEDHSMTFEVDTDPDPIWLDVDGLRADVMSTMRAEPDATWRIKIVARPRRTLAASIPAPALGWTAIRAIEGNASPVAPVRVESEGRSMTNGLLTLTVLGDGTLRLESADGVVADGVGRIEDGGDFGDSYNYAPPASDAVVDAPSSVTVTVDLSGPVRGRVTVMRRFDWPAGVLADGSARTPETEATEVVMEVELRADEPFVRIGLAFVNHSDDHRVRFHAPLPRHADASHAEGQFAVVERGMTGEGGYREEPLATYPAHGWIDAGGLAILLGHLAEYELTDAPDAASGRELAITALRSTGLISRNDNPYRQDPAGPALAIPDAQMRGPRRIEFALYPHRDGWLNGGVLDAAEEYRHPLLAAPGVATADDVWPPAPAGTDALRLTGDGVVLSSLRRRKDGWLEARVVNLASDARPARLGPGIEDARETNLRGVAGAALAVEAGGELRLNLGACEIRTVQFRRRETALARADLLDAAGPRQNA